MNSPFRTLNRAQPNLPASAMTTFSIRAPLDTHYRAAGCQEADCANWRLGWRVHVEYILRMTHGELLLRDMKASGKSFRETNEGPGQTYLYFEPGQSCFDGDFLKHRVRVGKPELFVVRGGDWRGNPRGDQHVHNNIENWIDDMSTHRDKLMTRLAQG